MFAFGLIAFIIIIILYVAFLIYGIVTKWDQSYVSFGASFGSNCIEVARPLTGVYYGSTEGKWQGNENFRYTKAIYEFSFNILETNTEAFQKLLNDDFNLSQVSEFTKNHDIIDNYIIWMHYMKRVIVDGNLQQLSFASSPGDIFNRRGMSGFVDNGDLICSSETIDYDREDAIMIHTFANYCQDLLGFFC